MSDEVRPELGRQIAQAQDRMVEHLDATRGARRARFVAAATRRQTGHGRIWIPATGLAVAAAAILGWFVLQPAPSRSPAVERAQPHVDAIEPARASEVSLRRGGVVWIDEDSAASVRPTKDDGAEVLLEHGVIEVKARGNTREHIVVEAGRFRVASEDAHSTIRWDASTQTLDIEVQEGEVVVDSAVFVTPQTIVAGQSFHLADVQVERGPVQQRPSEATETPSPEPVRRPKPARASAWRRLAADGKNADAVDAAITEGFDHVLNTASGTDLLSLARAARYTKDTKRAKQALAAVRERFAKSKAAAQAAYTLGRIAFDAEREFADAATWFATYLEERPGGALTREALGRLVESQHRSGQKAAAKKNAERYLEKYSDGPHADIARDAMQ